MPTFDSVFIQLPLFFTVVNFLFLLKSCIFLRNRVLVFVLYKWETTRVEKMLQQGYYATIVAICLHFFDNIYLVKVPGYKLLLV